MGRRGLEPRLLLVKTAPLFISADFLFLQTLFPMAAQRNPEAEKKEERERRKERGEGEDKVLRNDFMDSEIVKSPMSSAVGVINLDKHPVLQPPVQPDCQTFPSIQKFPHVQSFPQISPHKQPLIHFLFAFAKMSPKPIIISQSLSVPTPTPCPSMFEISHAVTCVFSAFYFITGKYSIKSMSPTVAYSLANWLTISKSL